MFFIENMTQVVQFVWLGIQALKMQTPGIKAEMLLTCSSFDVKPKCFQSTAKKIKNKNKKRKLASLF